MRFIRTFFSLYLCVFLTTAALSADDDNEKYSPVISPYAYALAGGAGVLAGYYGHKVTTYIGEPKRGVRITPAQKQRFEKVAIKLAPLITLILPVTLATGTFTAFFAGITTGAGIAHVEKIRSKDNCYFCQEELTGFDLKTLDCGHKLHEECYNLYHVGHASENHQNNAAHLCGICRTPLSQYRNQMEN